MGKREWNGVPRGSAREVRMRNLRFIASVILIGFLSGCTTFIEDTPLNTPPRDLSPRDPSSVEVFSSAPPARRHIDVQLITIDKGFADRARLVGLLRERAGHIGCDAIFIDTIVFQKAQATCIVYTE